ncbi:MAG: hypothetical protein K0Q95_1993 [Bacteroidota bacterium]|jgi:hypothetical protein|nr:hypothetical protein [Bacteroidota bacterium]
MEILKKSKQITLILMLALFAGTLKSLAQPLSANAGTNTSICSGANLTIGGSPSASFGTPPYTYSWSPSTGLSSATVANPVASPTTTTTYTLTVTDAVAATAGAAIIVNVNPIPNAVSSPSSQTICYGNSSSLGLSSSVGGASFSWTASQSGVTGASSGSGSVIMQSLTTTGAVAGTATYTITPTANGCVGTPTTAVVTVNPAPAMTSSGTVTICSGSAVNLPFTSNIPATYTWSATNNANTTGESTTTQSTSTLNDVITSAAPTTTNVSYTVQATSLAGCAGNFYPVTVTVNSLPVVTATPSSQTICSGTTANVSFSSSIAGTSYNYTVSQSGVTGAAGGIAGISQTLSATGAVPGTATYTITGTAAGCSGTPVNSVVTVNPTPTVSVNNTTICAGGTATLTATPSIGGGTFSWSPGGATSSSISVSPGTTTSFTCTYTKSGCSSNGTGTVTVNNPPVATFSYPSSQFCVSAPNPTPSFSGGGSAGTFTSAPAGLVLNSSTGLITLGSSTPGTYTVTNTIPAGGGCPASSATFNVTVNPLPNANATNSGPVCTGTSLTLSAASVAGATYSWTGPNGYTSTSQNPFISVASAANAGTYNLSVAVNGCMNSANTNVIVNPLPAVNAGLDQSGCAGSQINFSATSSGLTYSWTFGNGNNSALLSPSTIYAASGNYTATLTATSAQGCTASDNVNVTIYQNPSITTSHVNASCFGVCNGTATATSFGGSGPYVYSWLSGQTSPTISGLCAGEYSLTSTDVNGCMAYDTVVVAEPMALIATITSTSVNCNGACNGSAAVSVSGGTPSYTYLWSPGSQTGSGITGLCAGPYTVTVTDANGCTTNSTVVITQPSALTVTGSSTQTICSGDTATLNTAASGGVPPYSYNWSGGGSSFTGFSIFAAPLVNTTYTITATDNTGCIANTTAVVLVQALTNIYGHVSYSAGNLNTGSNTAVAFRYSSFLTTFDTVQVSPVNATGDFQFTSLPNDSYLVKVFNDTTAHPLLMPTYYGNEYMWDSALVINHLCGSHDTANIQMLETPAMSGPGLITGTITEGLGFGRVPGEPIPGIDIKLGRNPGGQLVASTQSGSGTEAGQYRFMNVPMNLPGETYTIYVDIPGLGRVSTYNFVIDASISQYPGMDYEADSTSIYITQMSVGISPSANNESSLSVYPNPVSDNANIEYTIDVDSKIELSVYNVIGDQIMLIENKEQSAGTYNYKVNMSGISTGVYFVKLKINNTSTVKKIIKAE